jgi:hypothetical protein
MMAFLPDRLLDSSLTDSATLHFFFFGTGSRQGIIAVMIVFDRETHGFFEGFLRSATLLQFERLKS